MIHADPARVSQVFAESLRKRNPLYSGWRFGDPLGGAKSERGEIQREDTGMEFQKKIFRIFSNAFIGFQCQKGESGRFRSGF